MQTKIYRAVLRDKKNKIVTYKIKQKQGQSEKDLLNFIQDTANTCNLKLVSWCWHNTINN